MAEDLSSNEKKERKEMDRGAKDDWEAIKIVLDSLPSLKQRVLYHIRAMRDAKKGEGPKVSLKQQRDDKLKNRNKKAKK